MTRTSASGTTRGRIPIAVLAVLITVCCSGLLQAATTLVTANVQGGWAHNRLRLTFYNGQNYFLIYSDNTSNLLFKASADNVTWSAQDTLVTDYLSAFNTFDAYLVNDSTLDLIYPRNTDNFVVIRTCTITNQSISVDAGSSPVAESWFGVSVTRTPSSDRIFAAGRIGGGALRVYSADQTGAAAGVTSWTGEVTTQDANVAGHTSITPYGSSDKALVMYQMNPGGTNSDGIFSRAVTRGGGPGISLEIGNLNAVGVLSSAVRVSDTAFHYILSDNGIAPAEYIWNNTAWAGPTGFANSNTTVPALLHDRTTDDLYVFAVDVGTDDVMRYKKPSGGAWDGGTIADGGEATLHSVPVAQMAEAPAGSGRSACEVVWAYRVANGANFDLYVGDLNVGSCPPAGGGLVVDTNVDSLDGDTSSVAALIASRGADGKISLREAIHAANNTTDEDTIRFAIGTGVQTIQPATALPVITDPVTIDGTTQPGYSGAPLVNLDGTPIMASANGLTVKAGGSTIKGLVIRNFWANGIELDSLGGNTITNCFIGTDSTGTAAAANFASAILVRSDSNTIGGVTVAHRNILSGNLGTGLDLLGSGANYNEVYGNYIGTDSSGTAIVGNSGTGLTISGGAASNTIGGIGGKRNVISGNSSHGILVQGLGTSNNSIEGNFIGVRVTGDSALSNTSDGVSINSSAASNTIGGAVAGSGNLISGNALQGIEINGPSTTNNRILGNYIGVDSTGTAIIANTGGGVRLSGSVRSTVIGDTLAGARNIVSGNGSYGVEIAENSVQNSVVGNYIGTNALGQADLGNLTSGIVISSDSNTVGGTHPLAPNLIAGNNQSGILISGDANTILGNYCGTNVDVTASIPNTSDGVRINGGSGNIIGGASAGAGNVLSGNAGHGVSIVGALATSNLVIGNTIGADTSGTVAIRNDSSGVSTDAPDNVIGGYNAGEGNLIAHNWARGVFIDSSASNTEVKGNEIRNHGYSGVVSLASGVVIAKNLIRNNSSRQPWDEVALSTTNKLYHNTIHGSPNGDGVSVEGANTLIRNNIITGNAGFGIRVVGGSIATESHNLVTDAMAPPANGLGRANVTLDSISYNVDPLYTDTANGDYSLSECASPAINTGIDLGGADQPPYIGVAPDIGAYESSCLSSVVSVAVDNPTFAFGTSPLSTWLSAQASAVINDGTVAESFVGRVSPFTDGSNNWDVSNTANGADSIRAQWSTTSATGPWTDIVAYDSDFTISTNVAVSDTVTVWFRIQTPLMTSSFNEHASTLTVTAEAF